MNPVITVVATDSITPIAKHIYVCWVNFQKLIFQTVWIQDRHFVGPDLDPNCLQMLSADDKSHSQQGKS